MTFYDYKDEKNEEKFFCNVCISFKRSHSGCFNVQTNLKFNNLKCEVHLNTT